MNRNYSLSYKALLFIILSCIPIISLSQIINIYPQVDSLSLWGTCTPPGFKCSLKNVSQDTARIVVYRYAAQWICGIPFGTITAYYDTAYFQIHDSLHLNSYKLFYTNFSSYHPARIQLPFDSIVYSYGGPCRLSLQLYRNTVLIDSAFLNFTSYQTGLGVDEHNNSIPLTSAIIQNYPNPFNPSTIIRYSVPRTGLVSLSIFNMAGQQVAILVNEVKHAGIYTHNYDGNNLSSGIYVCRLNYDGKILSNKMTFLK